MFYKDHYVYIKWSKYKFMLLSLYVDIILLASNDVKFLTETKI